MAMSNHLEVVATDAHDPGQESHLPRFFCYADSLIAKAMNHRLGRGENFWAPGSYRNTEIHGEEALRDRLVYALANPAAADLVETLDEWPGLHFGPEAWGHSFPFERPEGAFFGGCGNALSPDPDVARRQRDEQRREYAQDLKAALQADRDAGYTKEEARQRAARRRRERKREQSRERDRSRLPESATLRIVTPPTYAPIEPQARVLIQASLDEREAEHRRRRSQEGKSVLGAEAAQAVDPLSSAGSTVPDYGLTPVVACRDREQRKGILKCLVGWRRRYHALRKKWPKQRNKEFPLGTYQMAVAHDAKVMSEQKALDEGLIYTPTGPPRWI